MELKDKERWLEISQELNGKMKRDQFKVLCELHAKYFNHPYHEPCSCSPKRIVQWIEQLNKLSNG